MKRAASAKVATRATASTPSFQFAIDRDDANGSGLGCLYSQLVETRYGTFSSKMFSRVLGAAAARGAVERVDRLAVVGGDDAARLGDGLRRERILGARAEVHLARVGGADVVALVLELPEVALDVGARRDRLRLERLELAEGGGTELVGHDAAQVVLERQFVDDGQRVARRCRRRRARRDRRACRSRAARRAGSMRTRPPGGSTTTD